MAEVVTSGTPTYLDIVRNNCILGIQLCHVTDPFGRAYLCNSQLYTRNALGLSVSLRHANNTFDIISFRLLSITLFVHCFRSERDSGSRRPVIGSIVFSAVICMCSVCMGFPQILSLVLQRKGLTFCPMLKPFSEKLLNQSYVLRGGEFCDYCMSLAMS